MLKWEIVNYFVCLKLQSSIIFIIYLQLKVQNIMTKTFALYEISC